MRFKQSHMFTKPIRCGRYFSYIQGKLSRVTPLLTGGLRAQITVPLLTTPAYHPFPALRQKAPLFLNHLPIVGSSIFQTI
jgi:hypothetical protein